MAGWPSAGYLRLPLSLEKGKFKTCPLKESVERWVRFNLNAVLQNKERSAWLPADRTLGCQVPHHDFQTVVRTLAQDTSLLTFSIEKTLETTEPRLEGPARAYVDKDVAQDDPARIGADGSFNRGKLSRVLIRGRLCDGALFDFRYTVSFAGPGPVFEEEP